MHGERDEMLITTRGLPGSGKTRLALAQGMTRVNRDGLRVAMHGRWIGTDDAEAEISIVQRVAVEALLSARVNVFIDDCNLWPGDLRKWYEMAERFHHQFIVYDFAHVTVEECVANDARRTLGNGHVGAAVIRRMHARHFPLPALDGPLMRHVLWAPTPPSEGVTVSDGINGSDVSDITAAPVGDAPETGTPADETASAAPEDASFGAEQL